MSITKKKNNIIKIIQEDDKQFVYVHKQDVNLVDESQLDELFKEDELFVPLKNYTIEDEQFVFEYELPLGFKPLQELAILSMSQFQTIAKQLMNIKKLDGTQYIPCIQADNIVVNEKNGDVKYIFRGLRMVTAKEEVGITGFFHDYKNLIIELYRSFSQDEEMIKSISSSKSFAQVEDILQNLPMETKQNVVLQENKAEKPASKYSAETKKLIIACIVGLFVGLGLMYITKLLPMQKEIASQVSAVESIESDKAEYQKKLNDSEQAIADRDMQLGAYEHIVKDEHEEAVEQLEKIEQPSDEVKSMLVDEYLNLNSIDHLEKALALEVENKEVKIIRNLANKGNDKANKVVLDHVSENDKVVIEQAFLEKEYKDVIELANDKDADARMKQLRVKSLLKQDKPDEALKAAKKLKNKSLQKESLQLQKKHINKDKKMKKKTKKSKIKKINKQIKNL